MIIELIYVQLYCFFFKYLEIYGPCILPYTQPYILSMKLKGVSKKLIKLKGSVDVSVYFSHYIFLKLHLGLMFQILQKKNFHVLTRKKNLYIFQL